MPEKPSLRCRLRRAWNAFNDTPVATLPQFPRHTGRDCGSSNPPIGAWAKDGQTWFLWICDDCPNVWSDAVFGEFTLANTVRPETNISQEKQ